MSYLTMSGKVFNRIEEGSLLAGDRDLERVFREATQRKIGFGWQATVDVSDEQRTDVLGYLKDLLEIEEQIAGGAGTDPDYALMRSIRELLRSEGVPT